MFPSESGGKNVQRDIKIKRYVVKKYVYAKNMGEAESMITGGETLWIELDEDINNVGEIGFRTN